MSLKEKKLSLNEIKEKLKEKGLSIKGNKSTLLERLLEQQEEEKEEEKQEKQEEKQEEENYNNLNLNEIKEQLNLKTLIKLKEMLKERDLSINGKKEILINRLALRLEKEKDPFYIAKPKKKVKICEWCGAYMIKRNGRNGQFYGCQTYPDCQYTTSLSGYAKQSREALRGIPADDDEPIGWNRLEWARRRYDREERREREQDRRDEKLYG